MADPNVNINVSARDQASGVFEKIAKNLRAMQQESRRMGEGALERALGSGQGAAGAIADYLGVGLQAIVVDQIGKAFENATAKAVEMRDAMAEGKATAGEMVGEIARSIPIMGGFIKGWDNVIELMTNAKAIAKEMQNTQDNQSEKADARVKKQGEALARANSTIDSARERVDDAFGGPDAAQRKAARESGKRVKALEDSKDGITDVGVIATIDRAITAEKQAHAAELAKIDREAKTKQLQEERRAENDLKSMREKAHQDFLRMTGQEQAADLHAIVSAGEQKKRALKQQTQEADDGVNGPARAALYARAAEQEKLIDAATQAELAKYRQGIADKEAAKDIERQKDKDRKQKELQLKSLDERINFSEARAAGFGGGGTATPDLIIGRGSGAAARQRETATARDDKLIHGINEQTAVLRQMRDALTKNTAPPAFTSAY